MCLKVWEFIKWNFIMLVLKSKMISLSPPTKWFKIVQSKYYKWNVNWIKSKDLLFHMNRIKSVDKLKLPECLVDMSLEETAWHNTSGVLWKAMFLKLNALRISLLDNTVSVNGISDFVEKLVFSQNKKFKSFNWDWVKIG